MFIERGNPAIAQYFTGDLKALAIEGISEEKKLKNDVFGKPNFRFVTIPIYKKSRKLSSTQFLHLRPLDQLVHAVSAKMKGTTIPTVLNLQNFRYFKKILQQKILMRFVTIKSA